MLTGQSPLIRLGDDVFLQKFGFWVAYKSKKTTTIFSLILNSNHGSANKLQNNDHHFQRSFYSSVDVTSYWTNKSIGSWGGGWKLFFVNFASFEVFILVKLFFTSMKVYYLKKSLYISYLSDRKIQIHLYKVHVQYPKIDFHILCHFLFTLPSFAYTVKPRPSNSSYEVIKISLVIVEVTQHTPSTFQGQP